MKKKMLDTVRFYSKMNIGDYTDKKKLIEKLVRPKGAFEYHTGNVYLSGKLGNMQIQEHEHGFYIQGSLSRYYFGNNIQALNISQFQECVEMLSKNLQIPVEELGISRVDIADNIVTTHKPMAYFTCLHSCVCFEKSILPNGISFSNKSRKLGFYDKIEEHVNKRKFVPQMLRDKYLFRYEYRINERLSDFLKFEVPNITAFYTEENCLKVIEAWENQFNKITIIEPSLTKISDLSKSLKYKERNEIEYLLSIGGEGAALDELEILYKLGKYDYRKQVTREKNRVKSLFVKFTTVQNTGYSFRKELSTKLHAKAIENRNLLLL